MRSLGRQRAHRPPKPAVCALIGPVWRFAQNVSSHPLQTCFLILGAPLAA